MSDAWCDASDRRCGRTLRHGLQLASGAVGQSFPQVEDLDHRQDAQFLGQTGAAKLLGLMERRWTVSMRPLVRRHAQPRADRIKVVNMQRQVRGGEG